MPLPFCNALGCGEDIAGFAFLGICDVEVIIPLCGDHLRMVADGGNAVTRETVDLTDLERSGFLMRVPA
jgi:hypothetical protein